MEGQQLDAEEVVPGGDARGQVEEEPAVLVDQGVDGPDAGAGVEVVLGDLEPLLALDGRRGGVVDGGEPGGDGALVRGGDGVVGVAGELGAADDVLVAGADGVAGFDLDDVGGDVGDEAAGQVGGGDVLDGVVDAWGAEAGEEGGFLAVDGDGLGVLAVFLFLSFFFLLCFFFLPFFS